MEMQSFRNQELSSRSSSQSSNIDLGKKLIQAAKLGNDDEVRELMGKGAPFTTDWLGTSPLHYAAQNGHVTTTHLLMRAGMSMDARTKVDKTPLHLAAQKGQKETVHALIKIGAKIDAQDMLKMTPLHWAAEEQHLEIVMILVDNNANICIKSKFDKTPLDIALDKNNIIIANYLENEDKKNYSQSSNKSQSQMKHSPVPDTTSNIKLETNFNTSNAMLANHLAALIGASQFTNLQNNCSSEALSWLQSEMLNTAASSNNSFDSVSSFSLTEGGRLALQAFNKNEETTSKESSPPPKDEILPNFRANVTNQETNKQPQTISLLVNGQVLNIPANQLLIQPNNHQNLFTSLKSNVHDSEPYEKKRRIDKSPMVSDVLMHSGSNTDSYINSMLVDGGENEHECAGNEDEVLDLERDILQKQLERARREAKQFREELKKKEMEAEICRRRLALLNKNNSK